MLSWGKGVGQILEFIRPTDAFGPEEIETSSKAYELRCQHCTTSGSRNSFEKSLLGALSGQRKRANATLQGYAL
jgi:hypothetical protein